MSGNTDDSKSWDVIHKRIAKEGISHSSYATEKEKLFPRGATVCDLGGGLGMDTLYFLRNGHKVILIDISEFALKFAENQAKQEKLDASLQIIKADFGIDGIPLVEKSVDVIYSRIGLNYFPLNETQKIVSDIVRVLKPGGYAYLAFKSAEDAQEFDYLKKNAVELEPNVFIESEKIRSRFSVEQLKMIVEGCGISSFNIKPYLENEGLLRDEKELVTGKALHLTELSFTTS